MTPIQGISPHPVQPSSAQPPARSGSASGANSAGDAFAQTAEQVGSEKHVGAPLQAGQAQGGPRQFYTRLFSGQAQATPLHSRSHNPATASLRSSGQPLGAETLRLRGGAGNRGLCGSLCGDGDTGSAPPSRRHRRPGGSDGERPTAPVPSEALQGSSSYPETPQPTTAPTQGPIDAVSFMPSPSGLPRVIDAQNQTEQLIRDLAAASPLFRSTLDAATDRGRNPLTISFAPTPTGGEGAYYGNEHVVAVDAMHERNADVAHMQGVAVFEIHNAANHRVVREIIQAADQNVYEEEANKINVRRPDAQPVTGGQLFARDREYAEWNNLKEAHQAMTEGQQAGVPLQPVYAHRFQASPDGGEASWATFENYQRSQIRSGHTQIYIDDYARRLDENRGLDWSAPPPSSFDEFRESFGEPGP